MKRKNLILAAFVVFVIGAASQARAAEIFVIIANLNGSRRPHAQIDVSVDTSQLPSDPRAWEFTPFWFDVFDMNGGLITSFAVPPKPDEKGFASSSSTAPPNDNLFAISGGLPALVRVQVPGDGQRATAMLRQTLGRSEIVALATTARSADGTPYTAGYDFVVPVGDIATGAALLIANVSGADTVVDVFLTGTTGVPGTGKYSNPRLANRRVWILPLGQSDANSSLRIASSSEIVVQLAVAGRRDISETMVLPTR